MSIRKGDTSENAGVKIMCKLEFELKQVTPMIHFQPRQKGATLRATELKPKLDRFISRLMEVQSSQLEKEGFKDLKQNLTNIEKKTKECLLDSENNVKAFRYKVRIEPKGESLAKKMPVRNPKKFSEGYGAYFPINDVTKDSSFYSTVSVKIICFQEDLYKVIEAIFPMFIASTNFGFRQNKGFGHFIVKESEEQSKLITRYIHIFSNEFRLYKIKKQQTADYKEILENVNCVNSAIKKSMNYRKDGKFLNKEIVSGCASLWNGERKEEIRKKFPEAKFVEKKSKGKHSAKREVHGLENVGLLLQGDDNSYTIKNIGQNAEETFLVSFTDSLKWEAHLEDRGQSPMYFIPIPEEAAGENTTFSQIMILLECKRLSYIQMDLIHFIRIHAQSETEKRIIEEKLLESTEDVVGLLERIFDYTLNGKNLMNGRSKLKIEEIY